MTKRNIDHIPKHTCPFRPTNTLPLKIKMASERQNKNKQHKQLKGKPVKIKNTSKRKNIYKYNRQYIRQDNTKDKTNEGKTIQGEYNTKTKQII